MSTGVTRYLSSRGNVLRGEYMDFRRAYARLAAPSNFSSPHMSADLYAKVCKSNSDASLVSVSASNPVVIKIAKRKDLVVTVQLDSASGNAVVFANDNCQQAMIVSAGMTINIPVLQWPGAAPQMIFPAAGQWTDQWPKKQDVESMAEYALHLAESFGVSNAQVVDHVAQLVVDESLIASAIDFF